MKNYIGENIGYLVRNNNYRQDDFGLLFDLKKGVVSQYLQNKSLPKIETIQKICKHFEISIDDFINVDLSSSKGDRNTLQQNTAPELNTPSTNDKDAIIAALRETIDIQRELIETLRSRPDNTARTA